MSPSDDGKEPDPKQMRLQFQENDLRRLLGIIELAPDTPDGYKEIKAEAFKIWDAWYSADPVLGDKPDA